MDSHAVHLGVRMIHVLAATVLVGGSFGLALAGWSAPTAQRGAIFVATAARYEVVFWLTFAAIVATGVGNLGVFGEVLRGPETEWGRTLTLKLALVFALALTSAVRALVVIRLRDLGAAYDTAALAKWYGSTAALTAAIVCAAVWLAHG